MGIKVLHMLGGFGGGGIGMLLLNLQKKLPEHITFDYLASYPGIRDEEARHLGATIHFIPPEKWFPTHWAAFVGELVRKHRYDVVHIHRFPFGGNVLKAAKEAGARGLIAHSHALALRENIHWKSLCYSPYHYTINRYLLSRYATNIIGCSSDALRFLMGPLKNNPRCHVILNGVPIEYFAKKIGSNPKSELCERYEIPADAPVIGHLARLSPVKNQEFLLQIFELLVKRKQIDKAVLFIGGEGELRNELERKRNELLLQKQALLPGYCANAPELLINLFDCFVLPSKSEGLAVSIIEAVAAGLYVVCSDKIPKDVTETFPDRITVMSLSASLEHWAEAIEEAVHRRIPPEQGLELVRNSPMNFDYFAEQIIKIYDECQG